LCYQCVNQFCIVLTARSELRFCYWSWKYKFSPSSSSSSSPV